MKSIRAFSGQPEVPRNRSRRYLLIFAATLCVSASSEIAGAAPKQVNLTLYNGQHVQTTDALVSAFEKANPSIHIAVRSDDEDVLDNEIVTEGSRSPADIILTENSPALEFLQQHKLLAHVTSSTLAHTPAKYSSPQGDWVGVSARVSVLVYNPKLISKSALPTSILQLANSKYKGKLALAPAETDFQPIVTSVLRAYGQKTAVSWLNGIKANAGSHTYPDNETITNDVNRGLVAFGLINQYYWYRLKAEIGASSMHSEITYLAPRDPGYVLDISGAGILSSSKNQAAAQKFLAFLVSETGQEIIAHSISFEYPIASGVTTSQPETPFQDLKPYSIDIAQLGTGAAALALLQKTELL